MDSIFDIVTAQSISSYWNDIPDAQEPYLGDELFPAKKQLGTKISWIKGAKGVPIELKASTLDAKVMIRDRRGFNEIETKLPFFKEAVYIDEELRQKLLMVLATGNQTYIDAVMDEVFDDQTQLIRGASVTRERMRMQLLSTGRIYVNNNGTAYEYDYNLDADQKETLADTAKWSDTANSDPIADLNRWADAMRQKTGTRPTRAIMNSTTFNYILANEKLAKSIYITNNGSGIVTPSMVRESIRILADIDIAIYDKVYKQAGADVTDDIKNVKFFPDNVVTLIPAGTLGNTIFGTTPEEADLMSNTDIANVSIVDTGVAITTTKEADPVNVKTKVSEMVMPSFERADEIFIGTVA